MIALLLLAACGKSTVPLPAPSTEPPFPTGWWVTKGYAARFDAQGYVLVGKDGSADRRLCRWEWRGSHWSCAERPDDLLFWHREGLAYGIASAIDRFEQAAEASAYEAAASELPDPAVICRLAEACCRALPDFAYDCDEVAAATSLYVCRYTLEYLRAQTGAAAPPACAL